MLEQREYRVAISSPNSRCQCSKNFNSKRFDYCTHCQHPYMGLVERREYADITVGYYPTYEAAKQVHDNLKGY